MVKTLKQRAAELSTSVSISQLGLALIIAEGQIEDARKAEQRWKRRVVEAQEQELDARDTLIKWTRVLKGLKREIANA